MSRAINLRCQECNKEVWIGQSDQFPGYRLYTLEDSVAELKGFLDEHTGHPVRVMFDEDME